jgi:peptidoglycan-N-acetylglucosamine deacetylase
MNGQRHPLILAVALALAAGTAEARPLSIGFYLPWDAASTASLAAHAGALDVIAPMSGALDTPEGHVRWQPDAASPAALSAARNKPRVFPIVSNAHDEVWDAAAADGALLSPQARDAFITTLVAEAKAKDYGGYILDFENLSPAGAPAYATLLTRLHAALKPLGRELWVTAGVAADPALIHDLAASSDAVVLMAYDQCWATGTSGPIAGLDWLKASLEAQLATTDPGHLIVALGDYGYDWPAGQTAAVLAAADAAALAKAKGQPVARTAPDGNPHFAYQGPGGTAHSVWWLDAAAFRAQRAALEARHVHGVAIWRLGLEDPAIWSKAGLPAPLPPGAPQPACTALPKH